VQPAPFPIPPDGVKWPAANDRRQENTMPIELSHDHVAIRAVDYPGTVAWYQDKLDFTVDQEWPFGFAVSSVASTAGSRWSTNRPYPFFVTKTTFNS